jgi:hypothetical protein
MEIKTMVIYLTNETLEFIRWFCGVKHIDTQQFTQTYDKYATVQETPLWKEYKVYMRKYDLNKDFKM